MINPGPSNITADKNMTLPTRSEQIGAPGVMIIKLYNNYTIMRKILLGLLAVTALGLQSCDDSAKLAENLEGTWSGAPERLIDTSASSASVIDTYTFTHTPDTKGGNITITSVISVTGQIDGSQAIVQPFSLSASGTASVQGTWEAIDDDEIAISIDPKTLNVNIDPDAVVLSSSLLSGNTSAAVDSMKPALVNTIKAQVKEAVGNRYLSLKHIEDIDIKGSILKYEIGKQHYTMSRQGQVAQLLN